MLIGEYSHSLDAKGRVNFPAKLREEMGQEFILTKGLDNCLFVYSKEEFARLEDKIKQLPMAKARQLQRFFFAGAISVTPDGQGRIVIPQNLREYATLTKELIIVGVSERVEIWDKVRWNEVCGDLSCDSIAESMDGLLV